MPEPRGPGAITDPPGAGPDQRVAVASGFDTDGDGRPDTVVVGDGIDLVLFTDLDGDGYADRVLRIGPDAVVRQAGLGTGDLLPE